MAKKSTRGKIKERVDYSGLLTELRNKSTEALTPKEDPNLMPEPQKNTDKISKSLSRMLSDEKNLYFHHRAENVIHEKHCGLIRTLPAEELTPLRKYMIGPKQCPQCALRAYLRIGAEDYKSYRAYDELFQKMRANIDFIRKILVVARFKTRLTDASTIRIRYGDEAWKIKLIDSKGHVSLSHNDYRLHYDGTREKYWTYHIQNAGCECTTVQKAASVIMRYKSHRPLSEYSEREQKVIKILKKDPRKTQAKIAEALGVSLSTVKRTVLSLKRSQTLKRMGGSRYGYWKITM